VFGEISQRFLCDAVERETDRSGQLPQITRDVHVEVEPGTLKIFG
jgi:hypothetical protein